MRYRESDAVSGVFRAFSGSFRGFSIGFQGCIEGFLRVSGALRDVLRMIEEDLKGVLKHCRNDSD